MRINTLRVILVVASAIMLAHGVLILTNMSLGIASQGMVPQLRAPLFIALIRVVLLALCIVFVLARKPSMKWLGFAQAGFWFVVLATSLPTHVPLALSAKPVPVGFFSQAALSRQVLLLNVGTFLAMALLAWGMAVCAARLKNVA